MSASAASARPTLPKVLIADDHHLLLDALQAMMKPEFDVLAVDNSQAFVEAIDQFQPDVAVLDISMPGGDGFLTARKALERRPSLPIVFLSMYNKSSYVDQAVQLGAKAYLSKDLPAQQLVSAIHAVLDGENLLPPAAGKAGTATANGSDGRSELTLRQREVLGLIARGYTAKDIASQLKISVRTAEFHRSVIMQRLRLHSTAEMTRYAIANRIA